MYTIVTFLIKPSCYLWAGGSDRNEESKHSCFRLSRDEDKGKGGEKGKISQMAEVEGRGQDRGLLRAWRCHQARPRQR